MGKSDQAANAVLVRLAQKVHSGGVALLGLLLLVEQQTHALHLRLVLELPVLETRLFAQINGF